MIQEKNTLRKWMRSLHRDLGYFTIGLTLIYSLSGIVLSGRGLGWLTQEFHSEITMDKNIQKKDFNTKFIEEIKKEKLAEIFPKQSYKIIKEKLHLKVLKEENNIIKFNGFKTLNIIYNTQNGFTNVSFKTYPKAVKVFLEAHKASHEKAWFYLAIFYSIVLSFFAISAMFMVNGKYGFKRRGIYLMFAGILVVIGFLILT